MSGITQAIETFFLETVGEELCVFFCSLLPIIECRGAIPLGCGLGLVWWQNLLIRSPAEEHSHSRFLMVGNKAAINIYIQVSQRNFISLLWRYWVM